MIYGSVRAKHNALFDAMRLDAMNAPMQLAKCLMFIAETHALAIDELLALKDSATMLVEMAEGYNAGAMR